MPNPSSSRVNPPRPTAPSRRGLYLWLVILAFCVTAFVATYLMFVEAPPPTKIILATGGKNGAYYAYGLKYAEELKKEHITVDVKETRGSVENLQLLNDAHAGVAVAIVQSGVATREDHKHLVALGSLYREPLWVFYYGEMPLFLDQPPPKTIVIATGGKTGAYYAFAQQYAAELKKEGVSVAVRETRGSGENLQLLGDKNSGVMAAIVQSGIAGDKDREHLVSLGSLYREPLWVFYRGQKVQRLSDLAGKRVGVGPEGSGTHAIAMQLLKANGLVDRVMLHHGDANDTVKDLKGGELDAAFFVASIATGYIRDLAQDPGIHLLSFNQQEAYERAFPFLSGATMPQGLFSLSQNIPRQNVSLIAPTAMLVVRKDAHASVTALLLTAATRVHRRGDLLARAGEFPSPSYTDIPVSEEARQFYKTGSITLPKLTPIDSLSHFESKRIGIGTPGSGTYAVAVELLKANGLFDKVKKSEDSAEDTVKKLTRQYVPPRDSRPGDVNELDVAFFVAAPTTGYIQDLIKNPHIRLMSFSQHIAYHRRFRYLSDVTIPAGMVNLGYNIPRDDIDLIAPTAMLVARKDLHPAVIAVLLSAAQRIHARGDELTSPGEFPSAKFTDLPVSEDARQFYKSGPPMLQRFLPFWLASLADRLKIMLIPLIMLLLPFFRAAPPLVRWRTRRKIYLWYAVLREIDQKFVTGLSGAELDEEIRRLRDMEHQVVFVQIPLSYMEEFYHLRLHLTMLEDKLNKLKAAEGTTYVRA